MPANIVGTFNLITAEFPTFVAVMSFVIYLPSIVTLSCLAVISVKPESLSTFISRLASLSELILTGFVVELISTFTPSIDNSDIKGCLKCGSGVVSEFVSVGCLNSNLLIGSVY